MRFRLFILAVFLWGCQYPTPPTSPQSKQALFAQVEEANWQLMYQFAYTQSLITYAKSLGWKPPAIRPRCRSATWPR